MAKGYSAQNDTPVNATAARVVSGGVHYEPSRCDPESVRLEAPIPCKSYPIDGLKPIIRAGQVVAGARQYRNFTGKVYGDITIIGYLGGKRGKEIWLGKCACGYYVKRRDKTLRRKTEGAFDYCSDCLARERAKAAYAYHATGKQLLLKVDPNRESQDRAERRRDRLTPAKPE